MSLPVHLAHGLHGDQTAPDWPPLTLAEAGAVLAQCPDAGALQRILWHSPRPLSAACLVATTRGTLFIKRHHRQVRDAVTLGEEHRFLRHLHARGLPVATLLAGADGGTVLAHGDFSYEVLTLAAGVDLYRDVISWQPIHSPAHAHAAGHMLGRLATAAHGWTAPQRSTHVLVARSEILAAADPLATLTAQLPARPRLADWLARHAGWQQACRQLFRLRADDLPARIAARPAAWTHGDWHASNLFWSHAGTDACVSGVLDVGLAARNFALFDLATAIERNAIAWLQPPGRRARPELALALLAGYRAAAALTAEDVHLLADLLPVVHVDFALSELEYYAGITHSAAHADAAWHDFLLGHAAWFEAPEAQALLAAIRAQARWR